MNDLYIVILDDKSQPIVGPFSHFQAAWQWAMQNLPNGKWAIKALMPSWVAEENARENAVDRG